MRYITPTALIQHGNEKEKKKVAKFVWRTICKSRPCNCRPVNDVFGLAMAMNKSNQNCNGETFENIVNSFEYYNCNTETGKYTAFYVED